MKNKEVLEKAVACRLTQNEYDELQLWKNKNNVKNNSKAIRKAIQEVINNESY